MRWWGGVRGDSQRYDHGDLYDGLAPAGLFGLDWARGDVVYGAFAGYGSAAWVPTFFIRTYGWDAGQVGIVYGSIVAVFGCLGIVFGGRLADWMAKRGSSDANMRVGLYAALGAVPFVLAFPLMDSAFWAAVLIEV